MVTQASRCEWKFLYTDFGCKNTEQLGLDLLHMLQRGAMAVSIYNLQLKTYGWSTLEETKH